MATQRASRRPEAAHRSHRPPPLFNMGHTLRPTSFVVFGVRYTFTPGSFFRIARKCSSCVASSLSLSMMLRGGVRYLCVFRGAAQCGVDSGRRARALGVRLLCSSVVSSSTSCSSPSWPHKAPRPAGAAAAASRRLPGFPSSFAVACGSDCGVVRLWSSGRASKDSLETSPLTGGDTASSSSSASTPVKVRPC